MTSDHEAAARRFLIRLARDRREPVADAAAAVLGCLPVVPPRRTGPIMHRRRRVCGREVAETITTLREFLQ